ncbi:MAG: hypothetical protein USCAAHI_00446 [Beijerinckiaceae bacterium]|nr:MAG: hypothetical protein USCAAHI_00446 [Beijerinckiaceae bacterium]
MAFARWIAVVFGNEPPSIRLVALHVIAAAAQLIFDGIDKIPGATRTIAIAHHKIRLVRHSDYFGLALTQSARWHGMAIDQDGDAENLPRPVDKRAQARVIRFIEFFDPFNRFLNRHAARINLLRLAGHARDGPKSAGDTQRARVRESRQLALEHARVQLIRFAIEIKIGARKACLDQGGAQCRDPAKQSIDESVFRAAQHGFVEPCRFKKPARIDIPRMGRGKNQGTDKPDRFHHFERRIEFRLMRWVELQLCVPRESRPGRR